MATETPCPGCGVVLATSEEHAGKQARCPECSALFVVPEKPAVSSDPAAKEPAPIEAEEAKPAPPESAPQEEAPVAEAPPLDTRRWWLKTPQGVVYGPVWKQQLDAWCEEGRIADDCQVKHEEELAWRDAHLEYPMLREDAPPPTFTSIAAPLETAAPAPRAPSGTVNLHPKIVLPHRGIIIAALGVAGWITLICPIFGVIAWNMGNRDLELMAAGQMDASGMRMTQLGRMLGLIHVLSLVALTILGLSFAVIFLVMR